MDGGRWFIQGWDERVERVGRMVREGRVCEGEERCAGRPFRSARLVCARSAVTARKRDMSARMGGWMFV